MCSVNIDVNVFPQNITEKISFFRVSRSFFFKLKVRVLGIIYLSHKVIIWQKILPISGHCGEESVTVTVSQFKYNQAHQNLVPVIKVEIKIGFFVDYN